MAVTPRWSWWVVRRAAYPRINPGVIDIASFQDTAQRQLKTHTTAVMQRELVVGRIAPFDPQPMTAGTSCLCASV